MVRSFVVKDVYNMVLNYDLLDHLKNDAFLRCICGLGSRRELLHQSKSFRTFAELAASELSQRLHAALIESPKTERMVGHISQDSTMTGTRSKPAWMPVATAPAKKIRKRDRPRKGEKLPAPEPTRL